MAPKREDERSQLSIFGGTEPATPAPGHDPAAVKRRGFISSGQPGSQPSRPPEPAAPPNLTAPPKIYSVSEFDRRVKRLLELKTEGVLVIGEVTNLRRAGSGHLYFSLKDEEDNALIDCVMYRGDARRTGGEVVEGQQITVEGRATVYVPRGRLQFVVVAVRQSAKGARLAALAELKERLQKEGLFDPERRQAPPAEIRRIAVITSRDGAAIHDICRVAFGRGAVSIVLVSTPVQGVAAPPRIIEAIAVADTLGFDALVVTRGGGSSEDLDAYNDEGVVRAVAACQTFVLTAVGHEIDTTLVDHAADRVGATPSHAAEILVADDSVRVRQIRQLESRLTQAAQHHVNRGRLALQDARQRLDHPYRRVNEASQALDLAERRMVTSMRSAASDGRLAILDLRQRLNVQHPKHRLARDGDALKDMRLRLRREGKQLFRGDRQRLAALASQLDALSPLKVLGRGYALVRSETGAVVTTSEQVAVGDSLRVTLRQGSVRAKVEAVDASTPGETVAAGDAN